MKISFKAFQIEPVDEPDFDENTDDDDDMLTDVRSEANGRLLTPRNIAILLVVAVLAFFGGYFAAFALAHKKYSATEAELSACRRIIDASHNEISALKDSVDVLNRRIAESSPADSTASSSAGRTQTW